MYKYYILSVLNVLLLLLFIIGLTFYWQWMLKRRHVLQLAAKIPVIENLSCYPIIGHAHHFMGDTEKHIQHLLAHTNMTSPQPKTIYIGPMVYHLILRPEDIEMVLNSSKSLAKDNLYRFLKVGRGYGLLNLDLKTWRIHRKIIGPTLNQRILNRQVQIFDEKSHIMTNLMGKEAGNGSDIFNFVMNCTLDCVFETSMGANFHCQGKDMYGINKMFTRGMDISMLRLLTLPLHPDFIFNLTSIGKEQKQMLESISAIVEKILVAKQDKYIREKQILEKQANLEPSDIGAQNSLMDHLIKISAEKNNLSNDEIISETLTFVLAGSETSAVVVTFALTCLALFPEMQQTVYEEIIDVMGKDRDVEASNLAKLKYTEMVIKESMRLFPAVPVFLRKLDEDLELQTCTLPKEAGLILSTMTLHRHPLYYKDPLKFIPERFTPEEVAKRHPYSYLPFSAGPRNCIGLKYGMMLVKCLLASILRKYVVSTEYKSVEEIRLKQCIVLKPVLGFKVNITPRED